MPSGQLRLPAATGRFAEPRRERCPASPTTLRPQPDTGSLMDGAGQHQGASDPDGPVRPGHFDMSAYDFGRKAGGPEFSESDMEKPGSSSASRRRRSPERLARSPARAERSALAPALARRGRSGTASASASAPTRSSRRARTARRRPPASPHRVATALCAGPARARARPHRSPMRVRALRATSPGRAGPALPARRPSSRGEGTSGNPEQSAADDPQDGHERARSPTARARSGSITNRNATPIVPANVGAYTGRLVSLERSDATSSLIPR